MPYITEHERLRGAYANPANPGELAFSLTQTIRFYLQARALYNFEDYNAVVGVLDNVKDEFKRRVLNPYEDRKIVQNGDVYFNEEEIV